MDCAVSPQLLSAVAVHIATPNWRKIGMSALNIDAKRLSDIDFTGQQTERVFYCLREFVKEEKLRTRTLIFNLDKAVNANLVDESVMDCFDNLSSEQKKGLLY